MLAAMLLANRKSDPVPISKQIAPLLVVIVSGLAMFYAIGDMPAYGDVNSPANTGVGMDYIERTTKEIHIPNVVTAVLASYRGYDTFGEAVVIFSAGLGVLLLLGLNGNAGRWTARPSGQHTYPPMAPSANSRLRSSRDNSKSVTSSAIKKTSLGATRKSKKKRFKDKGDN
jgi:multicomponent Na+:H+ antiporter subunit B